MGKSVSVLFRHLLHRLSLVIDRNHYVSNTVPRACAWKISMGDQVAADVSKGLLAFRCVLSLPQTLPFEYSSIRKAKGRQECITSQLKKSAAKGSSLRCLGSNTNLFGCNV